MDITIPKNVNRLINILVNSGYKAYVVGGCVRDSIIGATPHDWDVCTSATPDQMLEIARKYGIKCIETGLKHGTLTYVVDGNQIEATTFRIDGEYSDNRRPNDVKFVEDINLDLMRRDFTINAIAYNNSEGLIDPFNGYEDLKRGIIRCVGNPTDRFLEDALRILRAIRFSATLDMKIDLNTSAAIHSLRSNLNYISNERIQSEICKMIVSDKNILMSILVEYKDVLAVAVPGIEHMFHYDQKNTNHCYDLWIHTVHTICRSMPDKHTRLAALFHDIGKPLCYSYDSETEVAHYYGHHVKSAELCENIMRDLKFSNEDIESVTKLVLHHDDLCDMNITKARIKRLVSTMGSIEMTRKLLSLKLGDIMAQSNYKILEKLETIIASNKYLDEIEKEDQVLKVTDLAVNGYDMISLGYSGKSIGEILGRLLDLVLSEELENSKDILMEYAYSTVQS